MKIAIPSRDGDLIFPHFGRTPAFALIEVENEKVVRKEILENNVTGHGRGEHQHQHQDGGHQQHSHKRVMEAFRDVDIFIANGVGRRMIEDMEEAGKKIIITSEKSVDRAVDLFLQGGLKHEPEMGCHK